MQIAEINMPDGRQFWLRHTCGIVIERRSNEQDDARSLAQRAPTEKTIVWIRAADGVEESFQMTATAFPGQKLSIFWGNFEGEENSPPRSLFNYAANRMVILHEPVQCHASNELLAAFPVIPTTNKLAIISFSLGVAAVAGLGVAMLFDRVGLLEFAGIASTIVFSGMAWTVNRGQTAQLLKAVGGEREARAILLKRMEELVEYEKAHPTVGRGAKRVEGAPVASAIVGRGSVPATV